MKNIKIFLVPSSDAVMGDMTEVRNFFRQLIAMDFLKMREKTGPRVHLAEGRLKVDDTIIIDLRKASSKELELLKI